MVHHKKILNNFIRTPLVWGSCAALVAVAGALYLVPSEWEVAAKVSAETVPVVVQKPAVTHIKTPDAVMGIYM